MRTNSRLAVGSPTARAVAILAATLLAVVMLAAAGIAGAQLLAASGPIVVDQSGGGTVETITEAVAMAEDGDEILVRPGTYAESVLIDKNVSVRGDGERQAIVIQHPEDAGAASFPDKDGVPNDLPYSVMLSGADATLADLTISTSDGVALAVSGGAPRIERVTLVAEPEQIEDSDHGLYVFDGSQASIGEIEHTGWFTIAGASPAIELSDLEGTCTQVHGEGSSPVLRDNRMSSCSVAAWALDIARSSPIIEGNTIGDGGIDVYRGAAPVIRNNVFRDTGERGIDIDFDSTATIEDNDFIDIVGHGIGLYGFQETVRGNRFFGNRTAIEISGNGGLIEGNEVSGGDDGLVVVRGDHSLRDNIVEDNTGRGIVLATVDTTLTGNRSCGNGDDFFLGLDAPFDVDPSNEFCDETPTE